ncbi:MAG: YjaG family protein, partial [Pseudomonadota bacterium]|nr:YjaG family protein [Pseudomonadota bacterium]
CAFLLALAERSFPNYALFADAVGLKTGGKMRQMLDLGWDMLQKDVAESAIPQLLAKLETLSPDVEAYDAYGVYPAFDFCQLLEQALLNRLNPAKHRATEASQMATGTVMSFVEVSEGEGLDEDELVRLLDQHPLMKEDKAFQRDLVLALKRQRTPTEQFVERLQADAANEGVSNLGISLSE